MVNQPLLEVVLLSPKALETKVKAHSVTVPAVEGMMQILPDHAPIIAELSAGTVTIDCEGIQEHYFITGGYLNLFTANHVEILADQVERAKSLQLSEVEKQLAQAHERFKQKDQPINYDDALECLKVAQARYDFVRLIH